MGSTNANSLVLTLIAMTFLTILGSCGGEGTVTDAEVEKAVEAITTEQEIKIEEEEKQSEIEHMDEGEAEVYIQKVEEEKERVEAQVAASPYLDYVEDLNGVVGHLKDLIDEAEGDCPKINEFMSFWNEHREDPIFLSAMKDRAIKKEVTTQYKRALKIKDSCKNP